MFNENFHFGEKVGWHFVYGQSAEVFNLRAENEDGDAAGKPRRDGVRDIFDHRSQARRTHDEQYHSGHNGTDGKIGGSVLGINAIQNDDERAGRAANADFGAAQTRNQKARDDGGEDARLWRNAGSDGKRHCQRQSYNANGNAGDKIRLEIRPRVGLERIQQFWMEAKDGVHVTTSSAEAWRWNL